MADIIVTVVLLMLGFFFGSRNERKHIASLILREKDLANISARADSYLDAEYSEAHLIVSSVVVANDYFKAFCAGLKGLLGGRLSSYESLMDRSRREVIVRLKEKARALGASEIIHLRIESNTLDKGSVELFASATCLK